MKKYIFYFSLVVCCVISSSVFATEEQQKISEDMKVFQKQNAPISDKNPFKDIEIPDWMKRIWFGGSYGTDTAESLYLETIQPLCWTNNGKGVFLLMTAFLGMMSTAVILSV